MEEHKPRSAAFIDEKLCIGCTLCIQACPVDAIVGCAKHMHTVIADYCTGCELCVAPCPVSCIAMVPIAEPVCNGQVAAELAQRRREFREVRLAREKQEALIARARSQSRADAKRAAIAAAMARARERLAGAR
ncbi:MAG TPA: RnfABCDGE type electron transport complex subunit B [Burkholderiales bacterium]|nr:RnfABCDGE type electron transport complex subunit B [Burkholderiales bacterium]